MAGLSHHRGRELIGVHSRRADQAIDKLTLGLNVGVLLLRLDCSMGYESVQSIARKSQFAFHIACFDERIGPY
jgi:hypothetical protein